MKKNEKKGRLINWIYSVTKFLFMWHSHEKKLIIEIRAIEIQIMKFSQVVNDTGEIY